MSGEFVYGRRDTANHMRSIATSERISDYVGEAGGGLVGDLAYRIARGDASLTDEQIIELIRRKLWAAYLLVRKT